MFKPSVQKRVEDLKQRGCYYGLRMMAWNATCDTDRQLAVSALDPEEDWPRSILMTFAESAGYNPSLAYMALCRLNDIADITTRADVLTQIWKDTLSKTLKDQIEVWMIQLSNVAPLTGKRDVTSAFFDLKKASDMPSLPEPVQSAVILQFPKKPKEAFPDAVLSQDALDAQEF